MHDFERRQIISRWRHFSLDRQSFLTSRGSQFFIFHSCSRPPANHSRRYISVSGDSNLSLIHLNGTRTEEHKQEGRLMSWSWKCLSGALDRCSLQCIQALVGLACRSGTAVPTTSDSRRLRHGGWMCTIPFAGTSSRTLHDLGGNILI